MFGDDTSVPQYNTFTLQFSEKNNEDLAGVKPLNRRETSTEKQLGVSASEIVENVIGLENTVSPMCRIKSKYGPHLLMG